MSCRRIQSLLPRYSVDGLKARDRARVAAHLTGCAACRAELDALAQAAALVERLPAPEPPDTLWAGVAAATVQRRAARVGWWVPAMAVLSLMLLAVGGWLLVSRPLLGPGGATARAYAAEFRAFAAAAPAAQPADVERQRADAEARAGIRWMAPGWLPADAAPAAYRAAACPCGCGGRTIQAVYRDGRHAFFIAQKVEDAAGHACGTDGACAPDADGCAGCRVDGTPVITRALADRVLVVVGDLHPDVLRRVAASIAF
ncbi:MAG TPA: zf-HC2 domain-containing protein [Armatimonadota bacterium]|nr:zf-HC2 domain-containing protein [Armatimonadota bacterium]HOS42406.1 zf-HC2 domain-containing protein [Armatimonadota bacterium]